MKRIAIFGAGLGLVAGFCMPWISLDHTSIQVSGLSLLEFEQIAPRFRLLLLGYPLAGLLMMFLAFTTRRPPSTVTFVLSGALLAFPIYKGVQLLMATTGAGMWLILGASLVGVMLPFLGARKDEPAPRPNPTPSAISAL